MDSSSCSYYSHSHSSLTNTILEMVLRGKEAIQSLQRSYKDSGCCHSSSVWVWSFFGDTPSYFLQYTSKNLKISLQYDKIERRYVLLVVVSSILSGLLFMVLYYRFFHVKKLTEAKEIFPKNNSDFNKRTSETETSYPENPESARAVFNCALNENYIKKEKVTSSYSSSSFSRKYYFRRKKFHAVLERAITSNYCVRSRAKYGEKSGIHVYCIYYTMTHLIITCVIDNMAKVQTTVLVFLCICMWDTQRLVVNGETSCELFQGHVRCKIENNEAQAKDKLETYRVGRNEECEPLKNWVFEVQSL
ncbi:unnamed protein product [Lepeophtheirus salmonis]|uniref:(salmon louse) hypothetical protein n=1 Tax=Lepeophtheirus salmonis TaxID=72036 RepID=A0A7R8H4A1_LEPSM|nr:unnamed protein product [Lepeophtheirus salmonis]CAF2859689.1 unnamed protein product [Lepeophtheirus salmonis]